MTRVIDDYRGGWAVVTGAARAEGLGFSLARELAVHGLHLVLVDVLADEVSARADELRAAYGVEVRPVVCDLGQPAPYEPLEKAVADVEVDVLVCNHMLTPKDTPEVLDMSLEDLSRLLDVNARGYTNLLHRFATPMRERRRGSLVVVASGAGLTSAPFTAAYAANKAYQIALGEALWFELRPFDVDVLVVAAGLMDTQGDTLAGYPQWLLVQPSAAASEIVDAIGGDRLTITPGFGNRLMLLLQTRLSSRKRTVDSIGRFMAKGLGKTRR